MVLNIFSLTIQITKQKKSLKKSIQNQKAQNNLEERRRKSEIFNRTRNY